MNANTLLSCIKVKPDSTLFLNFTCGILLVVFLLLDLSTPLGVAMGVLYIVVVLLSLWSSRKRLTIIVAIVSSVFTIAALFLKPQVNDMWKVFFNRGIALFAIWATATLGLQRKIIQEKRESALAERENALKDVRILRGFLPICASCKKIRDDKGYWTQIEEYIRTHSEADFSHGLCQDCMEKLYPQYVKKKNIETGGQSDG